MPKTTARGRARQSELPATLRRSDAKAQRTFAKAHDAAVREYGEGARAHRVAYAALKHGYEKVGDHWEPKPERGRSAAGGDAGGVDAGATKKHLVEIARRLDIPGRSTMNKAELVSAIRKANRRATAARR
ncbi:ChaB family protein [uncultured Mycolicibacterium sp.]|uniref:ChaB family protein n=1 Tax=uncultured Mycolicibacterium sp. TaxID=2320817 RepID=UPI002619E39F|nr:ChaB family protein [uncultured Mycolicibacterium sp.]